MITDSFSEKLRQCPESELKIVVQIWASVIWAIEPDSFFVILESVKEVRPEIDDFIEFLIQDRLIQIEFEPPIL